MVKGAMKLSCCVDSGDHFVKKWLKSIFLAGDCSSHEHHHSLYVHNSTHLSSKSSEVLTYTFNYFHSHVSLLSNKGISVEVFLKQSSNRGRKMCI